MVGMQQAQRRDHRSRLGVNDRPRQRVDRAGRNRNRVEPGDVRVLAEREPARLRTDRFQRPDVFGTPYCHRVVAGMESAVLVVLVQRIRILGRRGREHRDDGGTGVSEQECAARHDRVVEVRRHHDESVEVASALETPRRLGHPRTLDKSPIAGA
jgi:hypothetical protein